MLREGDQIAFLSLMRVHDAAGFSVIVVALALIAGFAVAGVRMDLQIPALG